MAANAQGKHQRLFIFLWGEVTHTFGVRRARKGATELNAVPPEKIQSRPCGHCSSWYAMENEYWHAVKVHLRASELYSYANFEIADTHNVKCTVDSGGKW